MRYSLYCFTMISADIKLYPLEIQYLLFSILGKGRTELDSLFTMATQVREQGQLPTHVCHDDRVAFEKFVSDHTVTPVKHKGG